MTLDAFNSHLPHSATPTLLAVSGGLDSVVMARLFHMAGQAFAVAHCQFQLRGAESEEDAAFVQQLAESYGVPFFVRHFETKEYAAQQGVSTQVAARELRYAWFSELCATHGFEYVATAHHLNDSVETMLLHLARGTGIRGLRGIPVRNGQVIRPLSFTTRAEILAFAQEHGLPWREDSSNASDAYTRNVIRHRLVPLMEEINPRFILSAAETMVRLAETEHIQQALLQQWWQEKSRTAQDGVQRIGKQEVLHMPHPEHVLFLLLEEKGFSPEQCRQLAAGLHGEPGLEVKTETHQALIDRNDLIISPLQAMLPTLYIQADDLMLRLTDGRTLMLMPGGTAPPYPDGQTAIVVDSEKLVFPLQLRTWAPGDVFQPFGMGGQAQKLQDFFTNQKLSRLEKDRTWLLQNGDGAIIWVVGFRLDERFKVVSETDKILKMSIL